MTKDLIQKLRATALDFSLGYAERAIASKMLAKRGIFIDRATIEWKPERLETIYPENRIYLFGFDPLGIEQPTTSVQK